MSKLGRKGTTLTELLVSIAIISIILSPMYLVISTGYSYYFIENDNMLAQECSREIMEQILEDLRMFENENTRADDPNGYTLTIKDSIHYPGDELIYTYIPEHKRLEKNGVSILDMPSVEVTGFSVNETIVYYDNWVIDINVSVKSGKGDVINLQNSYRTKVKLLP